MSKSPSADSIMGSASAKLYEVSARRDVECDTGLGMDERYESKFDAKARVRPSYWLGWTLCNHSFRPASSKTF